mgnify:FL=1
MDVPSTDDLRSRTSDGPGIRLVEAGIPSSGSSLEAALTAGPRSASAWLKALITAGADAEEELFSMIPVLGEASSQHAVDDWVDQVVDLLRAIGELATETELRTNLADGDLP